MVRGFSGHERAQRKQSRCGIDLAKEFSGMNHMVMLKSRPVNHIVGILGVTVCLALLVNAVRSKSIPWMQDWGHYVESRARGEGVDVITLNLASTYHQDGSHLFVDARPVDEFESGHISGALSLPFSAMEEHFDVLEQVLISDKPVVVYCSNRECDDALYLAVELRDMGVSNLVYYVDGYSYWRAAFE